MTHPKPITKLFREIEILLPLFINNRYRVAFIANTSPRTKKTRCTFIQYSMQFPLCSATASCRYPRYSLEVWPNKLKQLQPWNLDLSRKLDSNEDSKVSDTLSTIDYYINRRSRISESKPGNSSLQPILGHIPPAR